MFLAIAVECKQHPRSQNDYKVWYLEIDEQQRVVGCGVKTKEEIILSLFKNNKWRAFLKGAESSTPIEIFDFVAMNMFENTHFGTLPSLSEFQSVLDALQSNFELRSIAS